MSDTTTYEPTIDLSGYSEEIQEAAMNPPPEVPEHVRNHLGALLRRCVIGRKNGMDRRSLQNLEAEIEEVSAFIRAAKGRRRAESFFENSLREQTRGKDVSQLISLHKSLYEQHKILMNAKSFRHAAMVAIRMAALDALLFERYNGRYTPADPSSVGYFDQEAAKQAQERLEQLYAECEEAEVQGATQERLRQLEAEVSTVHDQLLELGVYTFRSY